VRARLSETREVNPEVQDALFQARYAWQSLTKEGFDAAMRYYRLALERDSLSAEAWVGIMRMWNGRAQMGLIPPAEARLHADSALARAMAIDPSLAGAQSELGGRRTWVEWDWQAGLEAFQSALENDPTDSRTRAYYAHLLLHLGRDQEALEQGRRAAQLDPFNTLVQAIYGMTLNFLHRPADAVAVLLPVLEREPQSPIVLTTLRTSYHLLGRHEDALHMWRASYANDPEALAALERGYRSGGYFAALRAVADMLVARSDTMYVRPWLIGTLYVRAGATDRAIGYLERAMAERDPNMPYISVDPIFDPMRREPRFRALMDRLGLPQ
jgi:tetratricopeptide (TPR) repeat protein